MGFLLYDLVSILLERHPDNLFGRFRRIEPPDGANAQMHCIYTTDLVLIQLFPSAQFVRRKMLAIENIVTAIAKQQDQKAKSRV